MLASILASFAILALAPQSDSCSACGSAGDSGCAKSTVRTQASTKAGGSVKTEVRIDARSSGCGSSEALSAADAAFLAEARRMMLLAGQAECGKPGCCNGPRQLAKFKVFVDGRYLFYGCAETARTARSAFAQAGHRVGPVQPVRTRITISGQRA